ncbi:GH24463 [Drosophila grimshawi]|uniref:GH24463 n=1 Tax=Drosophila grimshawi TaxID=7222 RepID=B4JLS0_DROGR|nr:GH24463 [Drosophila grimshawi]
METQLIIALLSICICQCLASSGSEWGMELDGRDNERDALLPVEPSREMDASCIVPDWRGLSAFGQQGQLEMKLKFQPEHQRQHSEQSRVALGEHLYQCANNSDKGKQKMMQTTPKCDDHYDAENTSDVNGSSDDDNVDDQDVDDADDDDDDDVDDNGKDFTERISCILRTLNENTKSLCNDLKILSVALTFNSANPSSESFKKNKNNNSHKAKFKNRNQAVRSKNRLLLKQDGYVDADNCDADAIDRDGLMPKHLSNEMKQVALKQQEGDWQPADIIEDQFSADRFNFQQLHRPFVRPTDRLIIPPLLQMLSRRSTLPLTLSRAPNQGGGRRYLHAINEMRLHRAVQAATAARYQRQKDNIYMQEHVQKFRENLKRIISNRAAIERRVSGLFSGGLSPH